MTMLTLNLSDDERELLDLAAQSRDGHIMHVATLGGVRIDVGNREFVTARDPRSGARWIHALRGLEGKGLIEALSPKRQVFRVTHEGYQRSDAEQ